MIIEITSHGSSLRKRRERFLIRTVDEKDVEIPAEKVSVIMISANAMISTAAIRLCIERQIQLVMTSWSGRPFARLWSSSPGRQTQIRRQQYLNVDTVFAFEITKKILLQKISRQKRFLLELKQNRPKSEMTSTLEASITFINKTIGHVRDTQHTADFAQHFLGFEGSCASRYFNSVSLCLPKRWQFTHRTQNPGLDPFNASLNYLYGMAYSSIEKIVILSGLDPTAGFYHRDHYAKPTLVFDLIEPHRPLIDKCLVYLFSKKMIKEVYFEEMRDPSFGIYLSKSGRQLLIATYKERCLKIIEKAVWQQCREISESLLEMDRSRDNTI